MSMETIDTIERGSITCSSGDKAYWGVSQINENAMSNWVCGRWERLEGRVRRVRHLGESWDGGWRRGVVADARQGGGRLGNAGSLVAVRQQSWISD